MTATQRGERLPVEVVGLQFTCTVGRSPNATPDEVEKTIMHSLPHMGGQRQ
jgi:predicted metal-dependent TIM-barrel fold hydrolase